MLLSNLLTEYCVTFPAEQLFFLFIALRLMQNPIGWCCDWLKIPELARGILSQSQYQWLVRAILHQAQGVFPVFVFLAKTRVSWCPIIYKVFSFRWVTRPRATCGTLRFQWKVTWVGTISGNYSGGFLIANCAGKECTARCSLVWLSGFQMFVRFEVVINEPTFPLSHTLQATCGTLHFRWFLTPNS